MQRGRGNATILANPVLCLFNLPDAIIFKQGDFLNFFLCMYFIKHCIICRPSYSTVTEDAGIEPRTVSSSKLADRRDALALFIILCSSHSATSHPIIMDEDIFNALVGSIVS
jgi:hypothetical protein